MDQQKIGKFIFECRKSKNLTQEQLAEKISVTSKSISRWENGNTMPDYSLLEDLCNELDISINELLSGEKIEESDYMIRAEENFIYLKKKVDRVIKAINIISYVILGFMVFLFILHTYFNWLYGDSWDDSNFSMISNILLAVSAIGFLITSALKYEAKK